MQYRKSHAEINSISDAVQNETAILASVVKDLNVVRAEKNTLLMTSDRTLKHVCAWCLVLAQKR